LKPEWWGLPLAQEEKCQGRKKTCDKRIMFMMMIIVIIMITATTITLHPSVT
jgi:hypothetical protein